MQPLRNNPTSSGTYFSSTPFSLSPSLRDGTGEVSQGRIEACPSPWQGTMLSSLVNRGQAMGISVADPNLETQGLPIPPGPVGNARTPGIPPTACTPERGRQDQENGFCTVRQRLWWFITSGRKFQYPRASYNVDVPFSNLLLIGTARSLLANQHGRWKIGIL